MVEKIKQAIERAYLERGNSSASSIASSPTLASNLFDNARLHEVDLDKLPLKRIITFHDADSNIESYRLLRTQLLQQVRGDQLATIGITSANADEGKSLTALNLAISLAKSADIRVVLVDGDIAHPSIGDLLDLKPKIGMVDLVRENTKLEEAVIRLNIPNLWVVPGRYENGSLLDHSSLSRIELLIDKLTDNNRNIVIVDLPPVLAKDDTMAMNAYLDGTILVVEEGSTQAKEVSRAAELLKQNNLLGCVLNKFSRYQVEFY